MAAYPSDRVSPFLPLGYLVCAVVAFVLAAASIPALAPELIGHYYHPRLLALTHTVTLGWIALAIMGASYQLIPIALERAIWSERLARWQLALVVVAVGGMVAHFYLGTSPGLAAAAGVLVIGIGLHLVNVGLSLRGLARWTFTARMIVLGHAGLLLTAIFGLGLALHRVWPFLPFALFPSVHAHMHLALLGWVTPMIFGVAARVYPMFMLVSEPSPESSRVQLWALAIGVPSLVGGLIAAPILIDVGTVAVLFAIGSHAIWVLRMARGRRRPRLDWGLRFVLTATVFLVAAAVLGSALAADLASGPRVSLAYATLALGGWISLTIVGMMLKIVPFLVWYRVYSPRAGREPVPTLAQLSCRGAEGMAYVLLTTGSALLAVALLLGHVVWIYSAGVVLSLGALAFAAALAHVLLHLRPEHRVRATALAR
jgi:hypothetical protein